MATIAGFSFSQATDMYRNDNILHHTLKAILNKEQSKKNFFKNLCFFFLLSTIVYFIFSQITQHSIQNITKQNKTTDTYSTSQGPIKREGEREGQQEHKSHSFIQSRISNKKHCQASMVEGLAPPTRAIVHSHDTICRRLRIQYVFLHMCGVNQFCIIVFFAAVKPANNCQTSVVCVSCVPASCFLIWLVSCPRFMSLLVNSIPGVCVWLCLLSGVFKSCLLSSMSSGLLVIPGVSVCLPCPVLPWCHH